MKRLLPVLLLGLVLPAAVAAQAVEPDPMVRLRGQDQRPQAYRYGACRDEQVAQLVGVERVKALETVRRMNLMRVRILHPTTAVSYEVIPERLTLVVADSGVVARAFCR